MNLLLIGYRGTGKTAVGRLVAQRIGWEAIDADEELERRAGKSIKEIFAEAGEAAFRDLESQVLADLVKLDRKVISLGGGVVLRPANRSLVQAAEAIVWLRASPESCLLRIAADVTTAARRPNLTASGGLDEIRNLLAQREPFYRECATLIVDTDDKSPAAVAAEILTASDDLIRRDSKSR